MLCYNTLTIFSCSTGERDYQREIWRWSGSDVVIQNTAADFGLALSKGMKYAAIMTG